MAERECPDCNGEGEIEHPFMQGAYAGLHAEAPPDRPLVTCETCDGTGILPPPDDEGDEPPKPTAVVEQQWLPIQTAPKDGTLIDLWAEGRRWINQRWGRHDPDSGCPFGPEHWICDFTKDPWRYIEPTHWMPRPGPPSTEPAAPEGRTVDEELRQAGRIIGDLLSTTLKPPGDTWATARQPYVWEIEGLNWLARHPETIPNDWIAWIVREGYPPRQSRTTGRVFPEHGKHWMPPAPAEVRGEVGDAD